MSETAHQSSRRPAEDLAERLLLIIEDDDAQRAAKIRALTECKQVSVLGACGRDCVDVALTVSPRALLIEATESGEIVPDVHRVLERDHRISAIILGHDRAELARRKYPHVAHAAGLQALRELVARLDARVRLEAPSETPGPANVDRNWQAAVLDAMAPESEAIG